MRIQPGLGLRAFWAIGENGWGPARSEDIRKISVLAQAVVIERVNALPGSPGNGDTYALLSADGGGAAGDIAVWEGESGLEEWVFYTPSEGWKIYSVTDNSDYRFQGGAWVAITTPPLPNAAQVSYNPTQDSNSGLGDSNVQDALDLAFRLIADIDVVIGSGGGGGGPQRPTFASTDSDFLVTATDENVIYEINEGSNSPDSIFATVPHDVTEDLPIGFTISLQQNGASQGEFAVEQDSNSSGVTTLVYPSDMTPRTRRFGSVISAVKKAANTWLIFGDLEPV